MSLATPQLEELAVGLSLRTVLTIQNQGDNIKCAVFGQDQDSGLFAGAINLHKNGSFHTTLATTDPIFSSADQAVKTMEHAVEQIRKHQLGSEG